LTASAPNGHQVDLSWTDNSTVETGYSVQQLIDAETDDWEEVAWRPTEANQTTGTLTASVEGAFAPLTSYTFRVVAYSD
jgi:hypothetical protein